MVPSCPASSGSFHRRRWKDPLHGSFMSRKQWIFPSAPQGARIVAITRPGWDESDDVDPRQFDYSITVDIVKAVLEKLKVDAFHVMGHSGGGPHAIAIKALLSPRCQRCILLACESEYVSDPKIDPVGLQCCGPRGCCGRCGLCCCLPCSVGCMFGGCCYCCKTAHAETPMPMEPPKQIMSMLKEGDKGLLGDNGDDYMCFLAKVMEDSAQGGLKKNGPILDFWAPKKGFEGGELGLRLEESASFGGDVEIWAGELDTTVPLKVSEHNHTLIPGSKLNVAA